MVHENVEGTSTCNKRIAVQERVPVERWISLQLQDQVTVEIKQQI
jgi:hypothetical protein